jgi:hypothetical protein
VPKYAFKLLLWKEDGTFDPSKDPDKVPPPWLRDAGDPNEYGFYISTKASVGISINGYQLASSDAKNHSGPSHHWARIWNGDTVMIWGDRKSTQTKLVFQCFWGASSQAREENQGLQLASPSLSQKLDAACQKAEKRIKEVIEKKKIKDAINADLRERTENIEREQERSRAFEKKRKEAMAYLDSRQTPLSRMASPASAPGTSNYREPLMFRMSSDNNLSIQ